MGLLNVGYQRQRCAEAIELVVIDAEQPLANISATARQQMWALDLLSARWDDSLFFQSVSMYAC
ncbi:MAG: hypothetical protein P8163_20495 [Candidatus Thiodiazotropha sp.]